MGDGKGKGHGKRFGIFLVIGPAGLQGRLSAAAAILLSPEKMCIRDSDSGVSDWNFNHGHWFPRAA